MTNNAINLYRRNDYMKIKLSLTILTIMLVFTSGLCESNLISDVELYAQGIKYLEQYQNLDDVQTAFDIFNSIHSGYGNANLYGVYADAIINIHNAQYDEACANLDLLIKLGFLPQSETNDIVLPSCEDLIVYSNACTLQQLGDCVGAADAFRTIINVWDSPNHLLEMKNEMNARYESGIIAYINGDFQSAINQFLYLGDYKDSIKYYYQVLDAIDKSEHEAQYQGAIEMRNNGDYDAAADIFLNLGDYSDSWDQYNYTLLLKDEWNKEVLYQTAVDMRNNGDYNGAVEIFQNLENYNDSAERLEEARRMLHLETEYQMASQLYDQQMFWDAAVTFYSIEDYKDSAARYQQAVNIISDEQYKQSVNNPRDWLIGHWTMTEGRRDANNDLIHFDVDILSIDDYGNIDLVWGETMIKGEWDADKKTIKVYGNQIYILDHRVLGGGNQNFSGLAVKDNTINLSHADSIIGNWTMTERRKDANNDIINFDINILSVDGNGNVNMVWGGIQTSGKWDKSKKTLTVFTDQVYVFEYGVLAGGNANYSGVAVR